MKNTTQLRGHCQVCGRQHAVTRGFVAKHGYTVKDGWFKGVCPGQHYAPIEVSRTKLDDTVAWLDNLAEGELLKAGLLVSGERVPDKIRTGRFTYAIALNSRVRVDETIPWEGGTKFERQREIDRQVWEYEDTARRARQDANTLAALGDKYHGQALIQVDKPAAPEPIAIGERRRMPSGRWASARSVDRGMVRWIDERACLGKSSTRSWRALPPA